MRTKILSVAALLALLPLAAQADQIHKVVYACENNQVLQVVFTDEAAVILQMGELVVLDQVRSASGAVYRAADPNYTYELSTKGKQAFLDAGKESVLKDCTIAD